MGFTVPIVLTSDEQGGHSMDLTISVILITPAFNQFGTLLTATTNMLVHDILMLHQVSSCFPWRPILHSKNFSWAHASVLKSLQE
jgi:hypothetical protein